MVKKLEANAKKLRTQQNNCVLDLIQEAVTLLAMLLESQSRPSYSPSPDVAHVL